ncbi:MAG: hypothetical protein WBM98_14640 [Maribacter sp.]|uniref:hypothetical protein n=1 Tax=Maribacter sp. TaxID=1897614 RepID=UPI003C7553C0
MVLTHILTDTKEQALNCIDILLDKKLLLDASLSEKTTYFKNESSHKLESKSNILIIGRTKALLFQSIDQVLQKYYPNNMPSLYAVPIVYMNDDQSDAIREKTAKI